MENKLKEWSSNEKLPWGFANWLKEYVQENEIYYKKGFRQIAGELGVNPSILSRWIAGMGPLTNSDVQNLAANLSPVVYSFLGLSHPVIDEALSEEILEGDQSPPYP